MLFGLARPNGGNDNTLIENRVIRYILMKNGIHVIGFMRAESNFSWAQRNASWAEIATNKKIKKN